MAYIPHHAKAALSAQLGIQPSVAVAACANELTAGAAPTELLLIPTGHFVAKDGRPANMSDASSWHMTPAAAARIIAKTQAAAGDLVIDYEHQTLNSVENGNPAPAAAWFKQLEWRDGKGLYTTDVRWTAKAAQMISAGEYRYLSPVFEFDPTSGDVTDLLMAALTNFPAIDGHADLATRAAARFTQPPVNTSQTEETLVKKEELIALLGLDAGATEADITAALKANLAASNTLAALRTELELKEDDEPKSAIVALKTKAAAAKPDMTQFVPKAVHDEARAQLAALKANSETAEMDALIKEGMDDGRIAGKATADWLRGQGVAALKAHLQDAPSLAALKSTQTQGKEPTTDDPHALNDAELAVCKNMGINPKRYQEVH